MKKILYMLLCILMLVGCTHQTGGNTGTSSSTTTSNTDSVVTTTTPVVTTTTPTITSQINTENLTDYERKLGYLGFDCSNSDLEIYNINKNSGGYFKITLNPDGDPWDSLNLSVGDGNTTYFGNFKLIKDNVFLIEFGDYLENHINADSKIKYNDGAEAYFKLDKNKLYYITEDLSLDEMINYTSDNYCKLIPVL